MIGGRVGVDLVPFGRVWELLSAPERPLLARLLSPREQELSQLATKPDIAGIAGRLAAKEAVFKLLRIPGQTLPWLGIEILKDEGGWPVVRLSDAVARLAEDAALAHVDVSITHDGPCAIAVAFGTSTGHRPDTARNGPPRDMKGEE